jgi:hypothetical protein
MLNLKQKTKNPKTQNDELRNTTILPSSTTHINKKKHPQSNPNTHSAVRRASGRESRAYNN